MLQSEVVKSMLFEAGADLCGIAPVSRFNDAPAGFHPTDVLPECQSVIVFAKRFLTSALHCRSTIPYTIVRNILSNQLDQMAVTFCTQLEAQGAVAIPTGTIGPGVYDKTTDRFRNIVSAKHCAVQAGLGIIGKNTLLITPQFGNMIWLSVILTNAVLTPDPILVADTLCPPSCMLCIEVCPVHALGEPEMKQMDCWNYAFQVAEGDDFHIKCFQCRSVCPQCLGEKSAANGSRY